eukprot:m.183636 g.183636  ORF g.183636 m.183636 type:complete len:338 (+) comp17477_c1_seq1:272-1285(+)
MQHKTSLFLTKFLFQKDSTEISRASSRPRARRRKRHWRLGRSEAVREVRVGGVDKLKVDEVDAVLRGVALCVVWEGVGADVHAVVVPEAMQVHVAETRQADGGPALKVNVHAPEGESVGVAEEERVGGGRAFAQAQELRAGRVHACAEARRRLAGRRDLDAVDSRPHREDHVRAFGGAGRVAKGHVDAAGEGGDKLDDDAAEGALEPAQLHRLQQLAAKPQRAARRQLGEGALQLHLKVALLRGKVRVAVGRLPQPAVQRPGEVLALHGHEADLAVHPQREVHRVPAAMACVAACLHPDAYVGAQLALEVCGGGGGGGGGGGSRGSSSFFCWRRLRG